MPRGTSAHSNALEWYGRRTSGFCAPTNPASAEHVLAVIEDDRLAGRDGDLGLIEADVCPRAAVGGDESGGVDMAVTDAGGHANGIARRLAGDPVDVRGR